MKNILSRLIFLVLALSLVPSEAISQYKRKKNEAFPKAPQFLMAGWQYELGLTYTTNIFQKEDITISSTNDSIFSASKNPAGKFGIYLGFGRYNILPDYFWFKYLDYGIGFKSFKGTEIQDYMLETAGNNNSLTEYKSQFVARNVLAYFNLNHKVTIINDGFLQNSIGVNFDYAMQSKVTGNAGPYFGHNTHKKFQTQLHYKIGMGFRTSTYYMIVPQIEIPLLNVLPFDSKHASFNYLGSWYKPIVVSIKVLLLQKKKSKYCPPVDALGLPEGYSPDGD